MNEKDFLKVLNKREIRERIISFLVVIGIIERRNYKLILHQPQKGNVYEEMLYQILNKEFDKTKLKENKNLIHTLIGHERKTAGQGIVKVSPHFTLL